MEKTSPSKQDGGEPIRLAEFIRSEVEEILARWEAFVNTLLPSNDMDREQVRDHTREMLVRIADEIEITASGPEYPNSFQQYAAHHGRQRQENGFEIKHISAEFSELRAVVHDLWTRAIGSVPARRMKELARFHLAIDQAVSESMAGYARMKDLHTRLLETTLLASPDPVCILGHDGIFLFANRASEELYDRAAREMIGKSAIDLEMPFANDLHEDLTHVVKTGKLCRREITEVFPTCPDKRFEFLLVPVSDAEKDVEAVVAVWHDITDRKLAEEKQWHNANHDTLTGLPNRRLFMDRLKQEMKHAARSGETLAVLFIDLDGFKEINDNYGHDAGDRLLCFVSQRLSSCVREEDTVARIGGDEFTVVLTGLQGDKNVKDVANKIMGAFSAPFQIGDQVVEVSCSIGVARYPQDASTSDVLLRNADQAMYNAKEAGRNRVNFFDADKPGMRLH